MARNRMIKPEFWEDPKVALLSDKAKLLFIALWNFADDEGFLENDSKWIAVKCFPYEKNIKIEKFLAELFKIGVIVEQNKIILIKNFLKHQKIKLPSESKLAPKFRKDFGSAGEGLGKDFGRTSPQKKLKEVKGKEEKEKKEKETQGVVDNFSQSPNRTETEENGKVQSFGKSPEPSFSISPNDRTAETANDQTTEQPKQTADNCDKSAKYDNPPKEPIPPIPKGFKPLVDYLVAFYGYDVSKAKLVANRVQSDNYQLTAVHCEEFKTLAEEDIIKAFDTAKKIKSLQKKSAFSKFSKALET